MQAEGRRLEATGCRFIRFSICPKICIPQRIRIPLDYDHHSEGSITMTIKTNRKPIITLIIFFKYVYGS